MDTTTQLASKFGVEIETRIQGLEGADPPDMKEDKDGSEAIEYEKQMKRWKHHVGPLSAYLAKNDVANHLTADQYEKEQEIYEEWYLTQDDSITQDKLCSYDFPAQFPSPLWQRIQLANRTLILSIDILR